MPLDGGVSPCEAAAACRSNGILRKNLRQRGRELAISAEMTGPLVTIISDLDYRLFANRVMEAARTGARGQSQGWLGQGRPSGQRQHAGQPINASTSKTVLRFFVVWPMPRKRAWGDNSQLTRRDFSLSP